MNPKGTSIEDEAAQLPRRQRARLALRLLESLEPGQDEDADALWLAEAERRLERYDQGAAEVKDADEAIGDIERDLK